MFTHLHVHSEFSLLDGMCRIKELIGRARELGMGALAITDHGVMYGVIDFYTACREAGLKPIVGIETYVAQGSHQSRNPAEKQAYHLTLLARNDQGYRNLMQLTTRAHLDGFYYRPRVDRELLARHADGLVCLSGCPSSELFRRLVEGRYDEAREVARWHREVFEHYFLEIQEHQMPEFDAANRDLIRLARELDIPLVATNDVHYVHREDAYHQDILVCIQTNSPVGDAKRMKMANDSFYLKSPEEMAALFAEIPEALRNTEAVAELCHLELEFNRLHLPDPGIPQGLTADDHLRQLCFERLPERYPNPTPEVFQRLEYELEVIKQTQFALYFLVVEDFATFARKRQIPLGVRGSAAGSIVLHCLGLTDIEPLSNRLVFERFLNIERKEMPDVDMDFADDRRAEVIEYVVQKYGRDHVAQIITFGTLGTKAAIRDVGRALGLGYADVDRVAKLVPFALHMTIDRALEESPDLRAVYEADEQVRHLVDTARRLEGVARHASTHAAGVVISREPLIDHVPLQRPARGGQSQTDEQVDILMTQYEMNTLAKIGLLKMDFLGLINLSILGRTVELLRETHGLAIDIRKLPPNDPKTFAMLSEGDTSNVFQLEGSGMRRYIKELKPSNIQELAAMIALYRPGPMAHIPHYIDAKHGRVPVTYLHPKLQPILEETYGVIVYQDQVLFILREIAGYSLGRADIVRKAMGKKIAEIMRAQRDEFTGGAEARGVEREVASQIFDLIEPFAGYAFNRSHSACYALVAYQTAYLKANYPVEYMTAVLMSHVGTPDKIASDAAECRRLGIPLLPPDVNASAVNFSVERTASGATAESGPAIRFGLAAVKNVGEGAAEAIVHARQAGGEFRSLEAFGQRLDLKAVNRRVLESLTKAGALDRFGDRAALLNSLDRLLALAQQRQRLAESGQTTMFDLLGDAVPIPMPTITLDAEVVKPSEKLAWEKELLGLYLSEHPFSHAIDQLRQHITAFCGQIDADMAGQAVTVAGIVRSVRQLFTKDRRAFLTAVLEDLVGSVEVTVWSEVYESTRELWQTDTILLVSGKVRARDDRVSLVCERVSPYEVDAAREMDPGSQRPIPPAAIVEPGRRAEAGPRGPEPGGQGPSLAAVVATPPAAPHPNGGAQRSARYTIFVTLRATGDTSQDFGRLRELHQLLTRSPGPDAVRLAIHNGSRTVHLDTPHLTTVYSLKLRDLLVAIVGKDGVTVVEDGRRMTDDG